MNTHLSYSFSCKLQWVINLVVILLSCKWPKVQWPKICLRHAPVFGDYRFKKIRSMSKRHWKILRNLINFREILLKFLFLCLYTYTFTQGGVGRSFPPCPFFLVPLRMVLLYFGTIVKMLHPSRGFHNKSSSEYILHLSPIHTYKVIHAGYKKKSLKSYK